MIPPVFKVDTLEGRNATHNLFGIWIRKDLKYYDAILAQEKFEWWYLRKWGALCMAPFLVAAPFLGWWLILPAIIAHIVGPRWPANLRRMELIGHTIEWLVAVRMGANPVRYLDMEAQVLTGYPQFKGWTKEETLAAMQEVEPIARKHV